MQTGRRDPNPRANGSAGVERAVAEDTGAGGGAVRCDGGGGGATITMTHSSLSLPPRPTTLPQKQLCRFFAFCLGATTMTMDDDDALSVLWTPPFFFFFSSLFPLSSSFPSFSLLFSSLISSLPLSSSRLGERVGKRALHPRRADVVAVHIDVLMVDDRHQERRVTFGRGRRVGATRATVTSSSRARARRATPSARPSVARLRRA